ncbi:MAG TPA: histidine kinase [Chitinophagaceae bacterium]
MSWHEFVFSEKRATLIMRHVIFWLAWWMYFASTYYYYLQVGHYKLALGSLGSILFLQTFLLVLIHLGACYFFIYILLPLYLLTRKYFLLAAGIIILAIFLLGTGYFFHQIIFPFIDQAYPSKISSGGNNIWWTSINSVLLTAPKVIAAATVVKLVKRWYLKQKEKERLEKEKLITDLQLMKAQIRPGFLFSSLDQIHEAAQKNSLAAPELLLKLADLLSYLLYECDEQKVPLEKELTMMKEYMALEKARYGTRLDLEIVIKGDMNNKRIAPLLLLPFIENSFKHCSKQLEQPWINLEVSIENEVLSMKLLNGVALTAPDVSIQEIKNIERRLQLLYPGKHELKKYIEHEIYVVLLKIDLREIKEAQTVRANIINGQELKKDYALN